MSKTIPQLTAATALNDTDYFPVAQESGITRRAQMTMALPGRTMSGAGDEVWISQREGDFASLGDGTRHNPFNAATMTLFDGVMADLAQHNNLHIHLIPKPNTGPFRTSVRKTWFIKPGWCIDGHGATVQAGGDASDRQACAVLGDGGRQVLTDGVLITNIILDANWGEVGANVAVGVDGQKIFAMGAASLSGNDNIFDNVWIKNCYGSQANGKEHFGLTLIGTDGNDCIGNEIRFCRAKNPQGSYGSPFLVSGAGNGKLMIQPRVFGCRAAGVNNGLITLGYTTGGVNFADVQDLEITDNNFQDCLGAAYSDTGLIDGVIIARNWVIRGWQGVDLRNPNAGGTDKRRAVILDNYFKIATRSGGENGGVRIDTAAMTESVIGRNIVFHETATGGGTAWGFNLVNMLEGAVFNNFVANPDANNKIGNVSTNAAPHPDIAVWGNYNIYGMGKPLGMRDNTIDVAAGATPAAIAANTNNYNPGQRSSNQRWSSDASRNVTGLIIADGNGHVYTGDGHRLTVTNVGSNDIVLKHQDTGSTAANRLLCSTGADITLTAGQAADFVYDGTTARWRVFKRN
jgi:hypothetical protein